jgi:DnaJ-domain-containing protein 1
MGLAGITTMVTAADVETVARWLARREAYRALDIKLTPETVEIVKESVRLFENEHWRDFAAEARRLLIAAEPSSK